jgi:hypothetical protein
MIYIPLNNTRGPAKPISTKNNINFNNPIKFKKSCRALVTSPHAASDKNLPDDNCKAIQVSNLPLNQNSPQSKRIDSPPPDDKSTPAFPSALWEMELLLKQKGEDDDISTSARTIERWTEAYKQMSRDAQELGIPASVIPKLPDTPTKEELRQARDHLERMIQSFLSAGL